MPHQIVVLSGKGGTGKTTLTGAFAALAGDAVLVDCDVDAPDLHLLLAPEGGEPQPFVGGVLPRIDAERCRRCGRCVGVCAFRALARDSSGAIVVDEVACEGCGLCAEVCAPHAIAMEDAVTGWWRRSRTRFGEMFHARMRPGAENSGKLVSLLRREAVEHARAQGRSMVLADGPPGIGCPVIASLSGADHVVVITEPTVAGVHDLRRLLSLACHFDVPGSVVVNKYDLNESVAEEVERVAASLGYEPAGRLPYDRRFTGAQIQGLTVPEAGPPELADRLREIWETVRHRIETPREAERRRLVLRPVAG